MKKTLFIIGALLACIQSFGQEAYVELLTDIEHWISSTKKETTFISNKLSKTVDFPEYGYSITGYFKKGIIEKGSWIIISDNRNNYKLSGVVLNDSQIKGLIEKSNGECTYGVFRVSNYPSENIINKVKYATELQIKDIEISYYKGYYNDCPTILSMNPSCLAINGKTTGRGYVGFSCSLDPDNVALIGYKNLKDLLLTANENCCMELEQDHKFIGTVKPSLHESGYIVFKPLEGDEINNPRMHETKISVKRMGNVVKMLRTYKQDSDMLSEELVAPSTLIPDEKLRNIKTFYQNATEICRIFRDGSSYRGEFKVDIEDLGDGKSFVSKVAYINGTYAYGNGDVFIGNATGRHYAGIPTQGTMTFADGSSANGNWLLKYQLTQDQLDSLALIKYPTEIKKQAELYQKQAKEKEFFNTYIKYERPKDEYGASYVRTIEFFSPGKEYLDRISLSYLLYNKKTGYYSCISKRNGKEEALLDFTVDSEGRHTVEIIYDNVYDENGINSPKYINYLSWHSNGAIQSIESYRCDKYRNRELYLVVNFFSDGTLKNAYMYEPGNNGMTILRKSKEAHPTFGGFTTKLYDLDGNYEKTIKWSIGESIGLFTSGYEDLSPAKLGLSEFKQIK